jgi:hypothetical protein
MAKVRLDIGAEVDFLTRDELAGELKKYRAEADAQAQGAMRGIKYLRMPRAYATPVSGTVRLGENFSAAGVPQVYTGPVIGPAEGYVWSVRLLACSGLGTGASPDILNIYRNGVSGGLMPIWQLNGNSFGYTFGRAEMVLLGGERLIAASVGSMMATGQVGLYGDAIEVPSEMIGKLVL